MPLKNGEGRFVADERVLDELEAEGRVVARYLDVNPNGSYRDIMRHHQRHAAMSSV